MSTARFNPVIDLSKSPEARLQPVPASAVELRDTFWEPRRRINREETLASQFQKLEDSGCLDNFRRAAGKIEGGFQGGFPFMDSDVYKWLEAASATLGTHPTPELEAMVETATELIEAAQQSDGYLNTYFMFERADKRWTNLRDDHEMYCAGHFIQAAVAHYRATGSQRLLKVAQGVADNICDIFGPVEDGKRLGTCGHPEIEMALVELYRATGEKRYLDEAKFLVDMRGHKPSVCYSSPTTGSGSAYHQDHVPYRELEDVTGHAVRMIYLAAGVADIVLETGEAALQSAMDKQWLNMASKRLYVTGGLGARYEGEAFGKNYELPNERAYTETCAAIASVMWNFRLLHLKPDALYADLMEHTLYNAVLPGLSLDGAHYYYQNPLTDDGTHRRRAWFGCACCPPNVARLLAQLPGYFHSVADKSVWVHLYAEGKSSLTLGDGQQIEFVITTNYPWDGTVEIEITKGGAFGLSLRIPAWCETGAQVSLNEHPMTQEGDLVPSCYFTINRNWNVGDKVTLELPMPVRRVFSHPYVVDNLHRVALQRGPILYAVEAADISFDVRNLVLPPTAYIDATLQPDLLNGVVVLSGTAQTTNDSEDQPLYSRVRPIQAEGDEVDFTAIPYYAWANRDAGPMQVWLREL